MKENFNVAETASLEAALLREAGSMVASGETKDHEEGARSFVEKRPPRFEGQ